MKISDNDWKVLKNVGKPSKVFKNVKKDKFGIFSSKMILQYSCGITINTT